MSKEFQRKEKYVVVKIKDIKDSLSVSEQNNLETLLSKIVSNEIPQGYVVVSEKNKELHEHCWNMIEAEWLVKEGEYNKAILKLATTELEELKYKISKLADFVYHSFHFKKLAPGAQDRLTMQLDAMQAYERILSDRVVGDLNWLVNGMPTSFENQKE